MRKTSFAALALLVLATAIPPAVAAIPWIKDDFDSAEQEAKVRKKPLLIYFHTTWCSWCAQMEDKVFSDDEVTFQANGFVALRLNCDRREGQRLMRRYHVSAFPTVLAVTVDKQVLGRLGMYRTPTEFVRFLQDCLSPGETLASIDTRIDKGDRSTALLLKSAEKRYEASDLDGAAERYEQAIASLGSPPSQEAGADARIGLGQVKAMRGDSAGALEQYTRVLKEFPDSKRLAEAFVGALFLLREENKGTEIDGLFQQFAGRFPDDPAVLNDHARRLLETGKDPAGALQKAQRAVALQPDSSDAQETLARALLVNQRPADALDAVTKAIEIHPTDKDLRILRLDILEAARNPSRPAPPVPPPTTPAAGIQAQPAVTTPSGAGTPAPPPE